MAAFDTIDADLLEQRTLLRLVLNRPKANILTGAMLGELGAALRAHRDDPHLRLVAIRGAGGNFSFGASIEEHRRERVRDMLQGFHGLLRELAAFPVPVAALVEGRCLGGAFELALCCHFLFATPSARFGCPEIKLGVFPPVLAAIGPLRMPAALAERLVLTGGELDADAARQAGLVAASFDGGEPERELLEWHRAHLAPLSAFALREATAALRKGSGLLAALQGGLAAVERQYLDRVVTSRDGNEGIEAFLEKRQPQWEDA